MNIKDWLCNKVTALKTWGNILSLQIIGLELNIVPLRFVDGAVLQSIFIDVTANTVSNKKHI